MNLLIESTIKLSCIVLLALAATSLVRIGSAAVRHWVLSAALMCAAAMPVLTLVVPSWHPELGSLASSVPQVAPAAGHTGPPAALPTAAGEVPRLDFSAAQSPVFNSDRWLTIARLAGPIWLAGAVLSLSWLLVGLGRLAWLASRAQRVASGTWTRQAETISRQYGLDRGVRLLQSDHPSMLVTWGLVHPKVILPATAREWTPDRARIVLSHELAHIQRRDWAVQLGAELLRAIYWFNPLVWMLSRRLREESEHACDDAVLSGGVEAAEYAVHLVDVARTIRRHRLTLPEVPAPAMARPSSLERRVTAMLNARLNRNPVQRSGRLASAIALLIVTVLVAGFGAQSFATFSGAVVDSTNRVVPGVTLWLTNPQNQSKHEVRSDATGHFEFVGLPAGDYAFETSMMGFATLRGTVTIDGRNVQQNLALEVGSLEETLTVVAGDKPAAVANFQRRPPRDPETCTSSAMGGTIRAPRAVSHTRPAYPENLKAAKIGGVVVLAARVGADGDIREVSVVREPHPDLGQAAADAVREWQYTTTLLNCVPVEVNLKVTVNFVAE